MLRMPGRRARQGEGEKMIYDNYFLVPDGALCKPVTRQYAYAFKYDWVNTYSHFSDALGKWETQEKTITITENEFSEVIDRISRIHGYSETQRLMQLKGELFK